MTAVRGRHRHLSSRSRLSSRSALSAILAGTALVALGLSGTPLAAHADSGTTTYSFESDQVGSVPAGCTTPAGRAPATVSDARAYDGTHSLEVHDTSTSTVVVATCQNATQHGAQMSVEVYPVSAAGLMIDIDGTTRTPVSIDNGAVFHLRVEGNGALAWYDNGTWRTAAQAGTVPLGKWSQIQISVPTDDSAAYLGVNGVDYGAAGPAAGTANPITGITGFGFASLGASANTDYGYFDDITFGPAATSPGGSEPPGTPATGTYPVGTTDGFESDAVGAPPTGCGTPAGNLTPTVTDTKAYAGSHSVEITDTSTAAQALLTCSTPKQQGAYLSFEVDPAVGKGFTVDLVGTALIGAGLPDDAVFRLTVGSDGSITWDQLGAYYPVAPAGTIPIGKWSHVQLSLPVDNQALHVTVDGTYVGSAGPATGNNSSRYDEVTGITGFAFASAGRISTGDDVFIDNVKFGPVSDTPAAALGTAPFQVGLPSTIDDVGQVQLPSTDVIVPNGSGQRILAEYPAHSDSSATSGTRLSYSDDGGKTWVSDQQSNPMPDASSYFMTRLRNGDLIAVNYHTYMTPNTGDTQASLDTAVSHDNGATWTKRTGTLTTPQAMRTISSVTDRPGTTLGGFVMVHPVVEDPDGTLYQTAYGYYASDARYRSVLLISHDGGLNWSVQGTIGADLPAMDSTSGYAGPCEAVIERLADGSFLAVMRQGSYLPMTYARSTDDGKTWTAQKQVVTGSGAHAQPLYSVFPTMELMPTGELVILAGRPGLVMSVSKDGKGDDWSTPVGIDYTNSENGAFTAVSPTSVLMLGDHGRVSPWQVWSRNIGIDGPCTQTITGIHNGSLSVGSGGLCLDNATVNGSITVTGGGHLVTQDSTIRGSVQTRNASEVALCSTNITGPTRLSGTTGNLDVGDTTRGCNPDTLTGPLSITNTHGHVVVDRATISGPVTVTGSSSSAAPVIAGTTVHGPLSCSSNTATPTDSTVADTVDGPSRGQCTALG